MDRAVEANERIVDALERAVADGLPVAWDVHTRLFGITNLSSALPPGTGQPSEISVDPGDPNVVSSFRRAGWDRTFVLEAGTGFEDLADRSVADAAAARGIEPRDVLVEVLRAAARAGDLHRPMVIGYTYTEGDIAAAVRTSRCAVGSDATTMNLDGRLRDRMLPPAFGWAAWFLRRIVGEPGPPLPKRSGGSPRSGGAGRLGRSGPAHDRLEGGRRASSTSRRCASRTPCGRRPGVGRRIRGGERPDGIRERPRHRRTRRGGDPGMTAKRRLLLHQAVPMRDGVNLSADVWLPHSGDNFPALLIRNIYNNADRRYLSWMEPFVDAGYAVVMQDCRGRHDSDGVWDPYMCELNDGFDTHEWVGRQPWCDGQVATFGVSYPGFTQTLPATLRSPALRALVPIASQQDNWGHMRIGGAIHWSVALFFANMIGRTMQTEPLALIDQQVVQRHLPLATVIEEFVGYPLEFYRGVIEHDRYDEWWSRYSLRTGTARSMCRPTS